MKIFHILFGTTKKSLVGSGNTRQRPTRTRLAVEPLEARDVPAVGKWLPPPPGINNSLPLGLEAEVRLIDSKTNLIDPSAAEVYQDVQAVRAMKQL
jgi:hypothetical protein